MIVFSMVIITACSGQPPKKPDHPAPTPRGTLDLKQHIAEFTSGMGPRSGYRAPTGPQQRAVADGVGLFLDGHRAQAGQRLADVGFRIRTLTDQVTGRRYAELADAADTGTATRGWGRVYVDLAAPSRWSVQVPHPVADAHSEDLGVAILRGTPGGVLVLAGAHRAAGQGLAADVAHRRDTVFHAVCDALLKRRLPGVQVHGFADDSVPGYDAVTSTGAGNRGRATGRAVADALDDSGIDACRAWARDCPLEGRTNMQGRAAAAAGVPFLHIEFSRDIRGSSKRISQAADAARTATAAWSTTRQ
ncbi:hypothetical protein XF35_37405 [Streptomyces platensis subsp. clarensis]|nr:hypothetical protein [Streptomyces platensis subsp. clarensis]